jgi:uncharacterized SAM-dependent methyltransferase
VSTIGIAFHESQWPSQSRAAILACLRGRAFDPRFHYESPSQTAAWLALHESHSPARRDPAVARLYPDAIAGCLSRMPSPACLVSLGCGAGNKDLDVLRRSGAPAYAAIDASPGMVIGTLARIRAELPSVVARGLVADVRAADAIASWARDTFPSEAPVLWLAFGIVPNIPAPEIPALLRAFARHPHDRILLGANLIPGKIPDAEMAAILPQYDNGPTRRWLALLPQSLGIPASPEEIRFEVLPPQLGHPWRVEASLRIRNDCSLQLFGESIVLSAGERLSLFFSNRFSPQNIDSIAQTAGLRLATTTISPSTEEGVFEIRP